LSGGECGPSRSKPNHTSEQKPEQEPEQKPEQKVDRTKFHEPDALRSDFFQDAPELQNTFDGDDLLRYFLRWRLPAPMLQEIEPGLVKLGARMASDVLELSQKAESIEPRHIPFDAWGHRVDEIEMSDAWAALHRVSAEEGMIATGYERLHGENSRVHQFAKLYLFHPSSAFYTCPLAMTDGAARVIELYGSPEMKIEAFKNLTSRNPQRFWTSGQWMTERTGGSDVSKTSTFAKFEDGEWRLFGDKWFTSATTSQMAMVLAKTVSGDGSSDGLLSLFYVELRDRNGRLQNMRINRLKQKLGTKALPTAEITLDGTPAQMVGLPGEGVKRISALLNITRLYNSACALGTIARTWMLAKDFASRRHAFGAMLSEQPLHLQTLADLRSNYEAMFHLLFHSVRLLGRDECKTASSVEVTMLRILTPICKLMTAKTAIHHASEIIESFGGAGYIEDTGIPKHLRDAQVYAIWEGTTNVLSLDVLRAIAKEDALLPLLDDIEIRVAAVQSEELRPEVIIVQKGVQAIRHYATNFLKQEATLMQAGAREFAMSIGRVFAASLMLEFADWCDQRKQRPVSVALARRYCRQPLVALRANEDLDRERLQRLVFG